MTDYVENYGSEMKKKKEEKDKSQINLTSHLALNIKSF